MKILSNWEHEFRDTADFDYIDTIAREILLKPDYKTFISKNQSLQ